MASEYSYSSLTSPRFIRVLHLQPSKSKAAPLRGKLEEVDLDARPSYHALSYVWGELEPPDTIQLQNPSGSYTHLNITPNCGQALRHIRLRDEVRLLWVDSICINQQDNSEKSHQVRAMSALYDQADNVIVWMDIRNIPRSDFWLFRKVLRVLDYFNDKGLWEDDASEQLRKDSTSLMAVLYKLSSGRIASVIPNVCGAMHEGIKGRQATYLFESLQSCLGTLRFLCINILFPGTLFSFFSNPYFDRTWTIQETRLGTRRISPILITHYGEMSYDNAFLGAALAVASLPEKYIHRRGSGERWAMVMKVLSRRMEQLEDNIESLISNYMLKATEPRDKAYGFLFLFQNPGLDTTTVSRPGLNALFQVDYNKSLVTVFTEFTVALAEEGSLAPIAMATSREKTESMPSWVLDSTTKATLGDILFVSIVVSSDDSSASGASDICPEFSIKEGTMEIRGLLKSTIEQCVELPYNEVPKENALWTPNIVRGLCRLFHMLNGAGLDAAAILWDFGNFEENPPTEVEKRFHMKDGFDLCKLRINILASLLLSHMAYTETSDRVDPVNFSVWLDSVRKALGPYIPYKNLDAVLKKTKHFAFETPATLMDSVLLYLVSLCKKFVNLDVVLKYYFYPDFSRGRTIFVTSSKMLGIGIAVQPGDSVALWEGCPWPMVIRQTREIESKVHCKLVSVSLIEGMMSGEEWTPGDLTKFVVH